MKVDKHPFPVVNMVEPASVDKKDESRLRSIFLTSKRAKDFGVVDPRVKVSAKEFEKRVSWAQGVEQAEANQSVRKPKVTSNMLINKY